MEKDLVLPGLASTVMRLIEQTRQQPNDAFDAKKTFMVWILTRFQFQSSRLILKITSTAFATLMPKSSQRVTSLSFVRCKQLETLDEMRNA